MTSRGNDALRIDDTIYALSSGAPPAGIAVIRISGASAREALVTVTRAAVPPARVATLRTLRDADGAVIDRGLVLWFPCPNSVTGEDVAELHVHGGRAVVARVLARLSELSALREAEPGEFTRRAFLNGRIDLLEAEGLADLLTAETEQQRRAALGLAGGRFSAEVGRWRTAMLRLAAQIEAMLDFGDEDDVAAQPAEIAREAAELAASIKEAMARPPVERLRDGIRVVLGGPPNAGKSSLLNAIVGREAALVSAVAGTTRDLIEVPTSLSGIPFLFCDTAGLHRSDDVVEAMGIDRAKIAIEQADLLLWLGDHPPPVEGALWLWPKADIRDDADRAGRLAVSATTGEGLDIVIAWLMDHAGRLIPREGETGISRRQVIELRQAIAGLHMASSHGDFVLQGEGMRSALQAIDRLTGQAGLEDVMDTIFGQFCLGK